MYILYIHICIYAYIYIYMYILYIHICIYIYIYMYTYNIHIHIYIYMYVFPCSPSKHLLPNTTWHSIAVPKKKNCLMYLVYLCTYQFWVLRGEG